MFRAPRSEDCGVLSAGRGRPARTPFELLVRALAIVVPASKCSVCCLSVSTRRSAAWPVVGRTGGKASSRAVMRAIATAYDRVGLALAGSAQPLPRRHQRWHLDHVQVPLKQVGRGRPAEVAGPFASHPRHVVAAHHRPAVGRSRCPGSATRVAYDPSALVDHGHGEGVLVRINACEHPIFSSHSDIPQPGRAQASQGDTWRFPTPLSSVNSPDEPPPGGTHYSEPRACRAAKG